jgi:hypothetical protein
MCGGWQDCIYVQYNIHPAQILDSTLFGNVELKYFDPTVFAAIASAE